MRRVHQGPARAAIAALGVLMTVVPATVAAAPSGPGPTLGVFAGADEEPYPVLAEPGNAARPFVVRLEASWPDVERERGSFDWSPVEARVAGYHDAGARVVLALSGSNPLYLTDGRLPSPLEGDSLAAWTAFVRSAARRFAGRVAILEIGSSPAQAWEPSIYAFVLKTSAIAARAEARAAGSALWIAQGPVGGSDLEWQRAFWAEDTAPYVDVLPLRVGPSNGSGADTTIVAFLSASAEQAPAPSLWAYVVPDPASPAPFSLTATAVRAVAASAAAAIVDTRDAGGVDGPEARWLRVFHERLDAEVAPAPRGGLDVVAPEGDRVEGFAVVGRFSNQKTFETTVVYTAPRHGEAADAQARLLLDTPDVKDPRVIDILSGADLKTGAGPVPGVSRPALRLLRADRPLLAVWERASPGTAGLEMDTEDLEIAAVRSLTAEEIIARYRAVQQNQDDVVERWMARGRLDYHFKLAQSGSTVDVGIDSNYFWERGGQLEWEQTDYYVNGNKVTWKNIPELPLIQPEKVVALPLDLRLDRSYAYGLAGEDEVDQREAYVVTFEPLGTSGGSSLYQGRVWIDKETFVRLKMAVVQTELDPPVLSNEESDVYAPVAVPGGAEAWLLTRLDGQQLWTVGGRNLVVRRRIVFSDYRVNPDAPIFEEARESAYASSNQMLRDTDRGFRYLEPDGEGGRRVKETVDTSQIFAAAGAYRDSSSDGTVPLGGVNWFDYDFLHKDIQFNVLFAGVVAFANLSDPSIAGTKADITVEATAVALRGEDKVFEGDTEDLARRIATRGQYVTVRLGYPVGSFARVTALGRLEFRDYARDGDAEDLLRSIDASGGGTFVTVLPPDHRVASGGLEVEFNRKGYTLRGGIAASSRSSWAPWGLYDASAGAFVDPEYDPRHERFVRWGVTAFKEWYLPKFQKLRLEANYLDGSDLDRFSRYQFSLFGDDRLNGFSGTGVRFDRGAIVRGGYAFNLFGAIRFDAAVETASVEDERTWTGRRRFTGAGLSGNVIGPWKTVIQLSYGRALASDIREIEGSDEFLVLVLKLF